MTSSLAAPPHTHGKRSTYLAGCRCAECATANRKWRKAYTLRAHRAGGAIRIDAAPVKRHIEALQQRMSLGAIEAQSGVARSTISRILSDASTSTHPRVARAILAVPLHATPAGHWINAIGATRRLQALHALGWSMPRIAEVMDCYGKQNLRLLIFGIRTAITPDIDLRVRAAYDDLWDKRPPAHTHYERAGITKALKRAALLGWAPPLAWDDDTIDDPDAQPNMGEVAIRPGGGRPIAELVEDIEWLLQHDSAITASQLAERLGFADRSAIQNALARHGYRDLLDRLNRNAGIAA